MKDLFSTVRELAARLPPVFAAGLIVVVCVLAAVAASPELASRLIPNLPPHGWITIGAFMTVMTMQAQRVDQLQQQIIECHTMHREQKAETELCRKETEVFRSFAFDMTTMIPDRDLAINMRAKLDQGLKEARAEFVKERGPPVPGMNRKDDPPKGQTP